MSSASTQRPEPRPVSALPGCYILLIGLVLLVGAGIWAAYTLVKQAGELEAFTDLEPAPLVVVEPASARVAELQNRLKNFGDAALARRPAELRMKVQDLNDLLAGSPRLVDLKTLIRVRQIGPDATFSADIRFPMNALPGKRRYLNGEMDGRFGLHPEAGLFVSVLDVRVPGRVVPPGFIDVYQRGILPGKNFGFLDEMVLRNFRDDPAFAVPLTRIATLTSEEGALVLSTVKAQTKSAASDAPPASPTSSPPQQKAEE
ncbi:MAG: hypothetical protein ACKV19_03505 [Verrucomicrobiales bacterium]